MKFKRLIWAIPITFFLFFLLVTILPESIDFPSFDLLGRKSSIKINVVSEKHLFYIAKYFPIEDEYSSLISQLKFKVYDDTEKLVDCKMVDHFFYGGPVQGKDVSAGSVFKLPESVHYPFRGRIESNIGDLDGVIWMQSNGSFLMTVLTFFTSLIISFAIVYFLLVKERRKGPSSGA